MNRRDRRKMTHDEYMARAEKELERIHNIRQNVLLVLMVLCSIGVLYGVWSILT